jgi:hypothetical protein
MDVAHSQAFMFDGHAQRLAGKIWLSLMMEEDVAKQ